MPVNAGLEDDAEPQAKEAQVTAQIFRFVRHENAQSYLDKGWIAHDGMKGTHHGQYSTIIEWPHTDRPPEEPTEIPLAG